MEYLKKTAAADQKKLKISTKVFYGVSEGGLMLVQNTLAINIMFFMTDIAGISAFAAGLLFLFTRIWDAFNDPMMGVLAEKTNMKAGKYRPYLLIGGIPLAISLVLNFTYPGFSGTMRLVWCYFAYILFGMSYTAIFIPYTTMISSISDQPSDWTSLASVKSFFNFLFVLISSAFTIPLVKHFGNGQVNAHGFQMTSIIYAVIMVILFAVTFSNVRERRDLQKNETQKFSLHVMKEVVFKNKPLLMVMIFYFLNYLRVFLTNAAVPFFFRYELGNIGLVTPFFILATGVMMGICLASPKLAAKIGKTRYLIGSIILGVLGFIGMYVFRTTFPYMMAMTVIYCIGGGASVALLWSLVAEVVNYTAKTTGMKYDALLYSCVSFVNKISAAIAGALSGIILDYFGYIPNVQQTPRALFGIDLITFIIPCLCVAGSAIPLLFFKLDEK